jgi:hypothetical protein
MTGWSSAAWRYHGGMRDRLGSEGAVNGSAREAAVENDVDITDEELTQLALSADPDAPLDPEAVPLSSYLTQLPALLPDWYMPTPSGRGGGRWRTTVILGVVAAFLVIEALGLCSTFGSLNLG